jgi:hypothetical protein
MSLKVILYHFMEYQMMVLSMFKIFIQYKKQQKDQMQLLRIFLFFSLRLILL